MVEKIFFKKLINYYGSKIMRFSLIANLYYPYPYPYCPNSLDFCPKYKWEKRSIQSKNLNANNQKWL